MILFWVGEWWVHTGIVFTGDFCFEPTLFGGTKEKNESEMGETSFQDLFKHMSSLRGFAIYHPLKKKRLKEKNGLKFEFPTFFF